VNKGKEKFISICFCAAVAVLFCGYANGQITAAQEFSGRATGVSAAVTTNGAVLTTVSGDTCPLPARGGSSTVTTSGIMLPGTIGTGTIVSTTSGFGITSQSASSVSDFAFAFGGWNIRAANITSRTQCSCCDISNPGCSGETEISGLVVTDPSGAQQTITITGVANQAVSLSGGAGTLTFNEKTTGPGSLTENAMHINLTSGATNDNVIIASAHSNIICPGLTVTAADVNISGRVIDSNGSPLPRTVVTIFNQQGQVVKTAVAGSDGQYTLVGVTTGQTYLVTAAIKSYTFAPRTVSLLDTMTGFDLIGRPQ
jgi:hypothetical protein